MQLMLERIVAETGKSRRYRDAHRLALACQEAIGELTRRAP